MAGWKIGLFVFACSISLSHLPSVVATYEGLESNSLYYGVVATAAQYGAPHSDCVQKLSRIAEAIRHEEVWGVKLLDASGAPGSGFYWGNTYWLGSRLQCLTAHSGKEPMIDRSYLPVTRETNFTISPFPVDYFVAYFHHDSKVQMFVHWQNETKISLGICLPSSCTSAEVWDLLQKYFDSRKLAHQQIFNSSLKVDEVKRTTLEVNAEHPGTVLLLVWAAGAVLVCIVGTLYDVLFYQDTRSSQVTSGNNTAANGVNGHIRHEAQSPVALTTLQRILLSFSWYSNFKTIFTTEVGKDSLVPIIGLRFLLTNFIIFGHSYVFLMDYFQNRTAIYMYSGTLIGQIFQNSSYGVDLFFMLGGFLTIYTLSKSKQLVDNEELTNWKMLKVLVRSVLKRFRRLTPVYVFVMLMVFHLTLFRNKSSGFWTNERNDLQCEKYWWTNLLYINNLYPGTFDGMCMSWSWYLACDMQFFVVTSFLYILSKKYGFLPLKSSFPGVFPFANPLLMMIWRRPLSYLFILDRVLSRYFKTAAALAIGIFAGSIFTLGVIAYVTEYKPFIDQFYQTAPIVYYPPWSRISCYLVGAFYAYAYVALNRKLEIRKIYIQVCWVVAIVLVLYLEYGFVDKNFGTLKAVLHTSLARTVFQVACGWMIFACLTGHGGFLNTILCAKGWRPFSHLTYAAYLTNPLIMYRAVSDTDGAWQFHESVILLIGNGLTVLTYMVSLFLVLTIEMPFDKLINILFEDKPKLQHSDTLNERKLQNGAKIHHKQQ